ncbi:MAG: hypothetical protein AAFQ08_01935, partial [Bacteroidota bacterium]
SPKRTLLVIFHCAFLLPIPKSHFGDRFYLVLGKTALQEYLFQRCIFPGDTRALVRSLVSGL